MNEHLGLDSSEPASDAPTGAQIIPFPVAKRSEPVPADRLGTALTALSSALTEQQAALQRWRQAMADLSGCMQKLSGGLEKLDKGGSQAS